MKTPLRIEVAPAGSAVKSVTQEIYFVDRNQKLPLLKTVLNQYKGSVLVFSRTKFGAKKIALAIRQMGETSTEIHSNKSLNQRIEALNGFKLGKYRVMVATDIAARGIDVSGIQLVVNYDLPENAEDYVHRIGRTGRAASTGHAISFATHDQRHDINTIERLIRKTLPVSKHQLGNSTESLPAVSSDRFGRSRAAARSHSATRSHSPARNYGKPPERSGNRPARTGFDHKRRDSAPAGKSSSKRKWSDYERGRKAPPQSLKKISQASEGFYLKRKSYSDDD